MSGLPGKHRWPNWLALGLVVGLPLLVMSPALSAGFLWCDDYTVSESPLMQDGAGLAKIWRGGETEQYYPLTYSLYWVTVQVAGANATVLHALPWLLHASCAALLFLLCRRVMPDAPAVLGAVLFGVHPLCVESVAWVYELKNPFATLWMLGAAYAWWKAEDSPRATRWRRMALGFFVLGLLSKSMVLVLPFLLGWCAWFGVPESPERRGARVLRLWPMALLAVASAVLTLTYEQTVTQAEGPVAGVSLLERFGVAGRAVWFYVLRLVFTADLAFAYPRFVLPDHGLALWAPTLVTILLAAGAVAWARCGPSSGRPGARVLALWSGLALLVLLPVSGLFDIYMHRYTWVADHLAYHLVLVSAPVMALAAWWISRRQLWAVGAILVSVLGYLAYGRAELFQDQERLWQQSVEQDAGPPWLAHVQLALRKQAEGKPEEAVPHYRAALAIEESVDAHVNLANLLVEQDRVPEAHAHYSRARELGTREAAALLSHASALIQLGLLDEARATYTRVLADHPDEGLAQSNRAALDAMIGQIDAEASRLSAILETRPEDAGGWRRLGDVWQARGRFAEAAAAWEQWIALEPDHPEALQLLTWVYCLSPDRTVRDGEKARPHALRLEASRGGDDPLALEVLAAWAALEGDWEKAVRLADRAARLVEQFPQMAGMRPRLLSARDRYAGRLGAW